MHKTLKSLLNLWVVDVERGRINEICNRNCSTTKLIKFGNASKDSANGAICETWVRNTFKWSPTSRINIELWFGAKSPLNSSCIESSTSEMVTFIVSTITFRCGSITARRQSENRGHCLKISIHNLKWLIWVPSKGLCNTQQLVVGTLQFSHSTSQLKGLRCERQLKFDFVADNLKSLCNISYKHTTVYFFLKV